MIEIRRGIKEDLPQIFDLIKELASFERAAEKVTNSLEEMEKDGFGPDPVFRFLVVTKLETGEIVGTAIYYYRYSTWKGKRLYLEDYIVTEKERGKGAGKLLFERVMQESLQDNCTGMMWQVLDWNLPTINFFNHYGSQIEAGWLNCHLQSDEIEAYLNAHC